MLSYKQQKTTLNSYQATEVSTANRLKLLIMLYEGAVRFTKQAEEAIKSGNYALKGQSISKALAIVDELANTLDHSHAPELAANLERLYTFVHDRLVEANIQNEVQPLHDALNIINVLHSAWAELSKKSHAELAAKNGKQTAEQAKQANSTNYFRISV